jgi:predicted acyltransferase
MMHLGVKRGNVDIIINSMASSSIQLNKQTLIIFNTNLYLQSINHNKLMAATTQADDFQATPTRLHSLDALRGFDMVWIMGLEPVVKELAKATHWPFLEAAAIQLDHPAWNGFHLYDLIFPLFLFMAGVSTPFSVGRELEKGTSRNKLLWRIIKRGLILVSSALYIITA